MMPSVAPGIQLKQPVPDTSLPRSTTSTSSWQLYKISNEAEIESQLAKLSIVLPQTSDPDAIKSKPLSINISKVIPPTLLMEIAENLLSDMNGLDEALAFFCSICDENLTQERLKLQIKLLLKEFLNNRSDRVQRLLQIANGNIDALPRLWQEAIGDIKDSIQTVSVTQYWPSQSAERILSFFPNLQTITLEQFTLTSTTIQALMCAVKLQTLTLSFCKGITDYALSSLSTDSHPICSRQFFCEAAISKKQSFAGFLSITEQDLNEADMLKIATDFLRNHSERAALVLQTASFEIQNLPEIWQKAIRAIATTVTSIILTKIPRDKALEKTLSLFPNLHTICLNRSVITAQSFQILATQRTLQTLMFSSCTGLTDELLASLSLFENLTSLGIQWCDATLTDKGIKAIAGRLMLKKLLLDGYRQITDVGVSHLTTLIQLEELSLSSCLLITSRSTAEITKLQTLRCVNITFCKGLFPSGLGNISTLRNLHTLTIDRFDLSNLEEFSLITSSRSIRHLELSHFTKQFNDSVFALLARMTWLTTLHFNTSMITEKQIETLRGALAYTQIVCKRPLPGVPLIKTKQ